MGGTQYEDVVHSRRETSQNNTGLRGESLRVEQELGR
jgi:hypothetical protein